MGDSTLPKAMGYKQYWPGIADLEHLRLSFKRSGNCKIKISRRRIPESLIMQSHRQKTGARSCQPALISIPCCAGEGSQLTICIVQIYTQVHHIPSQRIKWPGDISSNVGTRETFPTRGFMKCSLSRDLGRSHSHVTRQFRPSNFDNNCANS